MSEQKIHYTKKARLEELRKKFYDALKSLTRRETNFEPGFFSSINDLSSSFEGAIEEVIDGMTKVIETVNNHTEEKRTYKKRKDIFRPRKAWTKEEDELLVQNYKIRRNKEIARMLGNRSELAVSQRACTLGISRRKESGNVPVRVISEE